MISLDPFPWPVRSIFGIGRNYAAHIRELGNKTEGSPVVFTKPLNSLTRSGDAIRLKREWGRVDYETEVVLLIGQTARALPPEQAWASVAAAAIGIDVTARDLQSDLKAKGLPWDLCKGRDTFAPVGPWVSISQLGPLPWKFSLKVNGVERQKGNTENMIFSIKDLVSYLSFQFTLEPGDLIFTGTPEGVGPLLVGDVLEATLQDGLSLLNTKVTEI